MGSLHSQSPGDTYRTCCDVLLLVIFALLLCRPTGTLISDPAILHPEGLAFAKGCCYVASSGHATVMAVSVQDGSFGNIRQTLQLAEDACAWGMTAWDPSSYPLHAAAAAQTHSRLRTGQQQQQQASPASSIALQLPSSQIALQDNKEAPMAVGEGVALPAEATEAEFLTQAAQGCLFVTVQADVHKDKYWLPPKGPATGALVCVPLGSNGRMLPWREWSKVKIKRPSGVTIDHAGVLQE